MINYMIMDRSECEALSDQLDEHGCYELPDQHEIDDYGTMKWFIATLASPAADRLSRAISGRGTFRRFKDAVHEMGIEDEWCILEEDAHRKLAIRWCE